MTWLIFSCSGDTYTQRPASFWQPNQLESSGIVSDENGNQISSKNSSLKFISFMIIFIFGIIGGILILDFINRRRHGGFRV